MSERLIERLADISIKIFAIGVVNGIKKLEDLSAELNSLSADIAQRDWHTGTPTEAGLYVLFYKDKNFYDVQKITNGNIKTLKERPIFGRFDLWKKIEEAER